MRPIIIALMLCFVGHFITHAQRLNLTNPKKITLSDNTSLVFYPKKATMKQKTGYYYSPFNLRVSKRDTISEFSISSYDLNDDGKADGGIMHLLLKWGITKNQMLEATQLLQTTDSAAIILGAINVEALPHNAFKITPTELGELLIKSLGRAGGIEQVMLPTNAGSKIALSFRFNGKEIRKLEKLLQDETIMKKTMLVFGFSYQNQTIYLQKSMYELIDALL